MIKTKTLVSMALLVALSVIFTRLFSVMVPVGGAMALRLSFGEIPIALAGILFGPWAGAIVGVLADLTGFALFPIGTYFPGFTLSSALVGAIPGWLIYSRRKELTMKNIAIAMIITSMIVSVGLNTLWLSILYDKAFLVLLPSRLIARIILIPIYSFVLYTILNRYHAVIGIPAHLRR